MVQRAGLLNGERGQRTLVMGDDGVKREMWEGKIPVCFRLAEEEVGMRMTGERVTPDPCYVSDSCTCVARVRVVSREWLAWKYDDTKPEELF